MDENILKAVNLPPSNKIFKYVLEYSLEKQTLDIPNFAGIIHVAVQSGHVCLWAMLCPTEKARKRSFQIVWTGQELPQFKSYLGTVEIESEVLHVFEVTP